MPDDSKVNQDEQEPEADPTGTQTDNPLSKYMVGHKCPSGHVIEHIYGRSNHLMVYRTDQGSIRWEYIGSNDTILSKAANNFETLATQLPFEIQANIKDSVKHQLAMSLYNAVILENVEDAFEKVSKRIAALLTANQAKLRLILFSLICTSLIGAVMAIIYGNFSWPHKFVIATSGAGMLGSMFSLLQRNRNVRIPQDNGNFYIFLQAFFICVLGALSGLVVFLLTKSDIPIPVTKGNSYSVLIFAMCAGSLERLIPDFFDGLATKSVT